MARIILCPEFEYFTRLSPAMRRAMAFACKHGSSAYLLLEAVGGEAGEEAASESLDALWSTDPDRSEVLTAIDKMMLVVEGVSPHSSTVTPSLHLEVEETGTAICWLGARLHELRSSLT